MAYSWDALLGFQVSGARFLSDPEYQRRTLLEPSWCELWGTSYAKDSAHAYLRGEGTTREVFAPYRASHYRIEYRMCSRFNIWRSLSDCVRNLAAARAETDRRSPNFACFHQGLLSKWWRHSDYVMPPWSRRISNLQGFVPGAGESQGCRVHPGLYAVQTVCPIRASDGIP